MRLRFNISNLSQPYPRTQSLFECQGTIGHTKGLLCLRMDLLSVNIVVIAVGMM